MRRFDVFRKKRNISGYDRAGMVSDQEAGEMIALAEQIGQDVNSWLESHRAELLEK